MIKDRNMDVDMNMTEKDIIHIKAFSFCIKLAFGLVYFKFLLSYQGITKWFYLFKCLKLLVVVKWREWKEEKICSTNCIHFAY